MLILLNHEIPSIIKKNISIVIIMIWIISEQETQRHLFNAIHLNDYYKPALIKSVFSKNYEEYEIRGDKSKNLSLKQYLHMITPELFELINEKKNSTQNK